METQSQRIIQKILSCQLRDQSSIQDNTSNNLTQEQDSVQMVIQLGGNKSAIIRIHEQDDPLILAKAFCFQHSIEPGVISTLAKNIKNVKNMQFKQYDHNKSRISSNADKQNNSAMINVSQSMIQSSSKGKMSTKNRGLDRSSTIKNNSTSISNDCSRQSVFDRLYRQAKNEKVNKYGLRQSNSRPNQVTAPLLQQSSLYSDPCLLIYQRNTKAHQSALIKRGQLHQIQQSKLAESCTFRPQINPISEIIARRLPESYRSQQKIDKDMKRTQQYLQQKQKRQTQQCTFQPKVLNRCRSGSKSAERYKVLYQDSKLRRIKRKNSQQALNMSMKRSAVKINKISQSIVGDVTFFERLQSDQQRRKQRKSQIQAQLQEYKNRRPSTNRAPRNRPTNISIGEHLYSQAKDKSKQKQRTSTTKSRLICQNSDVIYGNVKKTAFLYIFALLDSDQDGLISNTKIQLHRLPGDILKLLAPLLIELQQMQAQLDQYEFIEALNRLFSSFSVTDKQKTLSIYRSKDKDHAQMPSFKPSLNQKSLLWAKEVRPQKLDLYQLWKQTQAQKQQRLQQIRTLRILQQLQQCTFHPCLFR